MAIRFASDRPIYLQFAQHVAEGILSGLYAPGERLPSVREFAEQYTVNPNTVQRSLSELEAQGLVSATRGSGWYVTQESAQIELARAREAGDCVQRFLSDMRRLGFTAEQAAALLKRTLEHEDKEGGEAIGNHNDL